MYILEDRVSLERSYIKTVDKLALSLDKVKEKNPLFEESIDLLKSSFFVRSHATESLLDGIKNDLVVSLKQCLSQQAQSFKQILDEGKKLEKDLKFSSEEAKKVNMLFDHYDRVMWISDKRQGASSNSRPS